ncbi:hypothetical protein ACPVPU_01405 [Sphingomonas sp. CJ99]
MELARQRKIERRLRERALHRDDIDERRGTAPDEVPKGLAALDRRRLVANFRAEKVSASTGRAAELLALAERRLASREAAHSADGFERRFEKDKLFGDDDNHAFRPPYGYY